MDKINKTFQQISASIDNCDTLGKLIKVQDDVIHFAGSPYEITELYTKYEEKSKELRTPKTITNP